MKLKTLAALAVALALMAGIPDFLTDNSGKAYAEEKTDTTKEAAPGGVGVAPAAAQDQDQAAPPVQPGGLTLIVQAFKGGQWALGLSLAIMLLIRLLDWKVLNGLIPKSLYPWIAALLGVAAGVMTAVSKGTVWYEAIAGGLSVGVAASGLWSLIGKYLLQRRPAVNVGVVLLFMLPALAACGTTTLQKLNTANEAAANLTKAVIPAWDAQCLNKAKTCKAEGHATLDTCKPLAVCQEARSIFYHAVNGVHIGVASGAPLALIGKSEAASAVLVKVLAALQAAHSAAGKAGLLEVMP